MKRISFKLWIEKNRLVAQRFPLTLFFILGLACLFFLEINVPNSPELHRLWAFFGLGIPVSVSVTLFSEEFKNMFVRIGLLAIAFVWLGVYCFFLPASFLPMQYYQLVVVGVSFLLSCFFVSFFTRNNDIPFWEFSKTIVLQLFVSTIFSLIFMIGLSLAVLSLRELFKIDIHDEVYQNLAVICFVLFAPVYFLANVPDEVEKHEQKYSFEKFVKFLGLYILLPILTVYALILYIYLIRIVIVWELPTGMVSTLVSVLGIGGFLCMFILYPLRLENENKFVNLLSRYFPLLLLPLLVLMSVGISRRLNDYGLTVNRFYLLIINIWLYCISIYLFFSKSKHLKWIIISFTTVALLSSVGPWSVYNVTERNLAKEVGKMLTQANLLKDGKVIDVKEETKKPDVKLANDLVSKISYICDNFGNKSIQKYFTELIIDKSDWEIVKLLGLNNIHEEENYFFARLNDTYQQINIDSCKTFLPLQIDNDDQNVVFNSDSLLVTYDDYQLLVTKKPAREPYLTIPLKDKIKSYMKVKRILRKKTFTQKDMTLEDKQYKLVISGISGSFYPQKDSISFNEFNASLFLK